MIPLAHFDQLILLSNSIILAITLRFGFCFDFFFSPLAVFDFMRNLYHLFQYNQIINLNFLEFSTPKSGLIGYASGHARDCDR